MGGGALPYIRLLSRKKTSNVSTWTLGQTVLSEFNGDKAPLPLDSSLTSASLSSAWSLLGGGNVTQVSETRTRGRGHEAACRQTAKAKTRASRRRNMRRSHSNHKQRETRLTSLFRHASSSFFGLRTLGSGRCGFFQKVQMFAV